MGARKTATLNTEYLSNGVNFLSFTRMFVWMLGQIFIELSFIAVHIQPCFLVKIWLMSSSFMALGMVTTK